MEVITNLRWKFVILAYKTDHLWILLSVFDIHHKNEAEKFVLTKRF